MPSARNDRIVDAITQLVLKRVAEDGVPVPVMPASLATCLALTTSPDYELAEVCRAVESEPMMAAAMLKRANGAEQAPSSPITTLKSASNRLGTKGVRNLIVELAAERIYVSRDKAIMVQATRIWQHCLAVAGAAREMGRLLGHGDVDDLYLAALLHDIGKPLIAGMLLAAEKQIIETNHGNWITSEQWAAVVQRAHRRLGVALAEKWQMPASIVAGIRDSSGYDRANAGAMANIVCVCNALAKLNGASTDDDLDAAQELVDEGKTLLGLEATAIEAAKATIAEQIASVAPL